MLPSRPVVECGLWAAVSVRFASLFNPLITDLLSQQMQEASAVCVDLCVLHSVFHNCAKLTNSP
jgi:hypothetical protein